MHLTHRRFITIFSLVVLYKLILAYFFPLNSDETYYITWADHLDYGFYDHPPMVGWLIYVFSVLGDHIFIYRLIPIVLSSAMAYLIYVLANRIIHNQEKAAWVGLIFLITPISVFNIMVTTDAPMIFFLFLTGLFLYLALKGDRLIYSVLAGLFLGLAFLSKYFTGLFLVSLAVYLVLNFSWKNIKHIGLACLVALPLAAVNLHWNYTHCWANVMIQFFNRSQGKSISLGSLGMFVAFQLYIITPWILYYLFKYRSRIKETFSTRENKIFYYFSLIPIAIIGVIGLKEAALHWSLPFYGFVFLLMVDFPRDVLSRIFKYTFIFTLVHGVFITTIMVLPMRIAQDWKYYTDVVMTLEGESICPELERYKDDYFITSIGYIPASLMSYHCGFYVSQFKCESKFGRQFDLLTNYKELDGDNILIFSPKIEKKHEYDAYFEETEVVYKEIEGGTFTFVLGRGFNYELYKDDILKDILEDLYDIPGWLPTKDCYYYDMYFPEKSR